MRAFYILCFALISCNYLFGSSDLIRLKARILKCHQSFLNLKNEYYADLPMQLTELSFQCAEGRNPKACKTLVAEIKEVVEQQKAECHIAIEDVGCRLMEYQTLQKAFMECRKEQPGDAFACNEILEKAGLLFLQMLQLSSEKKYLGLQREIFALTFEEDGTFTRLHQILCERKQQLEHDRPELLYRARMLAYAVEEYRAHSRKMRSTEA